MRDARQGGDQEVAAENPRHLLSKPFVIKDIYMLQHLKILCQLVWAKLRRDELAALALWSRLMNIVFDAMDAAIASIKTKIDADKAALDAANQNLATAEASVAAAQAAVDQRTAAITAAVSG
jgi:hypothetical protein